MDEIERTKAANDDIRDLTILIQDATKSSPAANASDIRRILSSPKNIPV